MFTNYCSMCCCTQLRFVNCFNRVNNNNNNNEKALGGDANIAEPKIFSPPPADPLPGGAGRPKFNDLEMVTSFTYKPSAVRIDARNFELSW